MKLFFRITLIAFLSLSSCQSKQIEKTGIDTNSRLTDSPEPNAVNYNLPRLDRRVCDFESIFTNSQVEKLTSMIEEFESRTYNQIAIVSIESIGSYTDFDNFSTDLSNYNGIGLQGIDNGLSIVFSKNLKRIRISTGLTTQEILTDEFCKNIIDHIIIPEFKNEDYFNGIEKGLKALIAKWD
jgi:uncharacterized protein